MKLRIIEKIFIALAAVLVVFLLLASWSGYVKRAQESMRRSECFEAAKADIIAQYGFETVLWLDAEKVKNLKGRDDFYIFTCLVEEDELHEYRFAVVITEEDGEIDVDTWQIKEGE